MRLQESSTAQASFARPAERPVASPFPFCSSHLGNSQPKHPLFVATVGSQHGLARVGAASGKHGLHVLLAVFVAITGIATWTKVTV